MPDDAPPAENSYDTLPYESWAFDATHPDRLAAMGALFGLDVVAPDAARVLELGCAAGGNLIPMAASLPNATFLGVDLSGVQIAEGAATIEELGLTNVRLEHRSILDIGPEDGLFDYIICHGVYSWVPQEVGERILAICAENLAPAGVAYVSYNTLPGWHLRAGVREMMNFHSGRFTTVQDRVEQARALLDFLSSAIPETDTGAYATLLRDELGVIRARADSYLFHEHLEQHNEPVYFHEFVRRLEAHDLRYLAESALNEMFPHELSADVQETLAKICPDLTHMEQYLDFLRNRMFRRTLICHESTVPCRELETSLLDRFLLGARVRTAKELDDRLPEIDEEVSFEFANGSTVRSSDPMSQRVLCEMGRAWPALLPFDELWSRACARRRDGGVEDALDPEDRRRALHCVLECVTAGLVEFSLGPQRFSASVTERPVAWSLTRHLAARGPFVTTLRHHSRPYAQLELELIRLADGTRSHAELAASLARVAMERELAVTIDGEVHSDPEAVARVLETRIGSLLEDLCRDGVLHEPAEAADDR